MAPTIACEMPRKVRPTHPFGERLVALRRARRLTQAQLAEAIDSSQRAISAYETVIKIPPAAVVAKLAQALRVSADELLGLKPLRSSVPDGDPEARRLWRKFQQVTALPEKDRRAVIRLVNSLVEVKQVGGRKGVAARTG